jgi:hypothetical protein
MYSCLKNFDIPKPSTDDKHDSLIFTDPLSCQKSYADFGEWPRESGVSNTTGSTNRNRQLLIGLMMSLSIKDKYCLHNIPKELKVYNTECNGPIHKALFEYFDNYICSEYISPETPPGTTVNHVRHEDLQSLSFANNSFDIVLSSEVFEHIPLPYKAHSEVFRVLKPGGKHIFTVPFIENGHDDATFAELKDGAMIHHREKKYGMTGPMYHGDPIHKGGVLVYNIFSTKMLKKLCRLGLITTSMRISKIRYGTFGPGNIVFVSEKNMGKQLI